MNVFDIIAIALFVLFVIVCTFRGFLKILSKWGAFFAAIILSKMFGPRVGEMLLGDVDIIGSFSHMIGTAILFVVLFLVGRIILGALAKLITKLLNAKVIDKLLGAALGISGGIAAMFLFAFLCDILVLVVSFFNSEAGIIHMINDTSILRFFIR